MAHEGMEGDKAAVLRQVLLAMALVHDFTNRLLPNICARFCADSKFALVESMFSEE